MACIFEYNINSNVKIYLRQKIKARGEKEAEQIFIKKIYELEKLIEKEAANKGISVNFGVYNFE